MWRLSAFATGGLQPDLVFLLDVEPDVASRRMEPASGPHREAGADVPCTASAPGYLTLAGGGPGAMGGGGRIEGGGRGHRAVIDDEVDQRFGKLQP